VHTFLEGECLSSLTKLSMLTHLSSRSDTAVDITLGYTSCRLDEPDFHSNLVLQAYNKYIPHRGCILFDGAVSDDRLRRSEVFCATALMALRLQQAKKTDLIVPVGIYLDD